MDSRQRKSCKGLRSSRISKTDYAVKPGETIAETIQREELDIDGDGNVVDREGNLFDRDDITAEDVRRARGM